MYLLAFYNLNIFELNQRQALQVQDTNRLLFKPLNKLMRACNFVNNLVSV